MQEIVNQQENAQAIRILANRPGLAVKTGYRAGSQIVYGTDSCEWTSKQREYWDAKGIPSTFVNCAQQTCPSFVAGYPTLVQDGNVLGASYCEL
jgi:hypothetical protein